MVASFVKRALKGVCYKTLGVQHRVPGSASVLLTFDDGPEPSITEGILARLREHRARAVFFTVGCHVERAGNILQAIVADGHLIGNHSFEHLIEEPGPIARVMEDLRRCQSVIQEHVGLVPRLYRPPFGRLRLSTLRAAHRLSLKTLLWSIDTGDWQFTSSAEAAARGVALARSVAPGDIVLCHESNPHVLAMLDAFLPVVAARGFDLSSGVDMV